MEADAEIWDTWGQDMIGDLFYFDNGWNNCPVNVPLQLSEELTWKLRSGFSNLMDEYTLNSIQSSTGYTKIYDIFDSLPTKYSDLKLGNFPIGNILDTNLLNKDTVQSIGNVTPFYYNNRALLKSSLTLNQTIFSPAFLFNLATIIDYNTLFAIPDENTLRILKQKGIFENGKPIEAHKDGNAIDFILPDITKSDKMPFLYPVLLGNYTLKQSALDTFENILVKYFDKVSRSSQKIQIDVGKLKGEVTSNIQTYSVYIYHIEVKGKDYKNMTTEVVQKSNHSSGIEGK
jgi:hypothetical protein